MCRLWSGSVGFVLVLTCLACGDSSSNKSDAGTAAVGGGGAGGKDSEARDAGDDAGTYNNPGSGGQGGAGGVGGTNTSGGAGGSIDKGGSGGSGGAGGSSGVTRPDVEPAECLPDPSDFTACGGNVVGSWRGASFCFDSGIDDLRKDYACPDITQNFNVDYRMLVQFKANGDYAVSQSSDVTQNVVIPKTCLGGKDDDCSILGPDDTDPTDDDWTLTVHDSGDNCLMDAEKHISQSATGTFVTDGNMITIRDADGPETSTYCVDGDKLTVKSVADASGSVTWGQFTRE